MIVDVQCEDDTVQIANLVRDEDGYDVEVRFLVKVKNELYDFDDEISVIPKESITGWYDVEKLEDTDLYVKVHGGYELLDDSEDEDYTCSDEDDDESESESLVDEDDEA
jgi:hypothetical protein